MNCARSLYSNADESTSYFIQSDSMTKFISVHTKVQVTLQSDSLTNFISGHIIDTLFM